MMLFSGMKFGHEKENPARLLEKYCWPVYHLVFDSVYLLEKSL
jgi:hypothetical protein